MPEAKELTEAEIEGIQTELLDLLNDLRKENQKDPVTLHEKASTVFLKNVKKFLNGEITKVLEDVDSLYDEVKDYSEINLKSTNIKSNKPKEKILEHFRNDKYNQFIKDDFNKIGISIGVHGETSAVILALIQTK
jgi:hypothetical protein